MCQWIAILVALVCLSGSSHSRGLVKFDETDDSESWQAEPDDYGPNRKSKYYSEENSWETDEDFENDSGYENGYDHDQYISINKEYNKGHGSHAHDYHDHHHGGHHHDHGYNNWGHRGPHTRTGSAQPDHTWGSIAHHSHSTSFEQPGRLCGSLNHDRNGYISQPDHNLGYPHHSNNGSPGQPVQNWGTQGHNTQNENPGQTGQSTGTARDLPQNNVNDADRIVFPDFNDQVFTPRSPATNSPTITARPTIQPPAGTTTSATLLDLVICIRACPTTSEYNPVCGTNNVTYSNPGALQCARNCGINVAVARQAPCPRAVPQPFFTDTPITSPTSPVPRPTLATTIRATTIATVNPTQFTNINDNFVDRPSLTTIPFDILQNVFGNGSPTISNTEEPEFEIDQRRKP